MMIVLLPNHKYDTAKNILALQQQSYYTEALLIDNFDIPALNETVEAIRSSKETFIGYFVEGELRAFIAYEYQEKKLQITRLVVHPDFFRRGFASYLLKYLLNQHLDTLIYACTSEKNQPAIDLYHSFGFAITRTFSLSDGHPMVVLERHSSYD
jgi:ribosomal protein S18 acetylase RimI-like enzyme